MESFLGVEYDLILPRRLQIFRIFRIYAWFLWQTCIGVPASGLFREREKKKRLPTETFRSRCWTFWMPVVGGDTFLPLAWVLGLRPFLMGDFFFRLQNFFCFQASYCPVKRRNRAGSSRNESYYSRRGTQISFPLLESRSWESLD